MAGFDEVDALVGASRDVILAALARPTPDRLLVAAQALRAGLSVDEINAVSGFDPWFLDRLGEIVEAERGMIADGLPQNADGMRRVKAMGFAAKSVVHPRHIAVVHQVMRPTAAEIAEAHNAEAAYAAAGQSAVRFNGKMLEEPVMARYRRILAQGQKSDA